MSREQFRTGMRVRCNRPMQGYEGVVVGVGKVSMAVLVVKPESFLAEMQLFKDWDVIEETDDSSDS